MLYRPIFAFRFAKAGLSGKLPDSIKVVRQILVLFVQVRILVGQRNSGL